MDSPLLRPSRNSSSSMEVEIPDQNSLSRRTEPLQPAARFAELQLRREKRRTSENKFQNSMNPEVADAQMKACNFCQQLIVITIYDQHVLDCAKQIQDRSRDNDKVIVESTESSQNQDEPSLSNTMETEDNQLQLAGPIQNPVINSDQESPENFSNLFGRFRNPLRNFPRPETSEPRLPNPSSLLSTIFNSIFHPGRNQERTNSLPITESANQPIPDQQQNQPAEPDMFPRGAILVRTIQQGPNGSVIVRMRVIPLNGLFNDPQENAEPNEPQEGRMLGSLLNMLIALHGIQGGGFGDFLNMFQEEKGLEKDVIDSLPLVPYDSEAFKNVDEESKKCTICLDNFEDKQEVRFLWCLHRFHKNCVDQWLDKHTNCPICKKDYSEAVKECESSL